MSLGRDQQYDETWIEQDKVRRRLEIKRALKLESIQLRYNPFFHMKEKPVLDPAIDRYMDTRKTGRLPNAPFNPKLFFSMFSVTIVPIFIMYAIVEWERRPYLEALNKGDYPLEKRMFKHSV